MPPVTVSFLPENGVIGPDGASHVSVILGRNGEGKSRILSAIATTFQLLHDYRRGGSRRGLPISRLGYVAQGSRHEVISSGSEVTVIKDGIRVPVDEAALPRRVIGLSMTPFDKFPMGGAARQLDLFRPDKVDVYSYLGMRERMGQISTGALLTRAVEGLVARVAHDDRGRLTGVFSMLGFHASIEVIYRIQERRLIIALAEGAKADDLLNVLRPSSMLHDRLRSQLNSISENMGGLRAAARLVLERTSKNFFHFRLDLISPDSGMIYVYEAVQLLRRLNLIRLHAFEVTRNDGSIIDLNEASSGELSIAITFMSLAGRLENDSLVLIDEPETNLHPEWQARYLDLLLETFGSYRNCHFVLATHSPLILSDAPPNATLASLGGESLRYGREVSGRPVDYLLVEAFDVATADNYYVQEQLVKALRLAADGETNSCEYQEVVQTLAKIRSILDDSPGVVEIIGDLERIAKKAITK